MARLAYLFTIFCLCVFRNIDGNPTDRQNCGKCIESVETFFEYARNELANGENLLQMCDNAPLEFQSICRDLLVSYGQDVSNGIDESYIVTLCKMFDQCERADNDVNGSPLVFDAVIDSDERDTGHLAIGLPCMLCVNIMKIAHMYLGNKEHQASLLKLLKGLCHFIPIFKTECTRLVDSYGPMIVRLAANWLRPELCQMFHLCPTKLVHSRESCRLCKFGVGIIRDTISDPEIEARITQFAEIMCMDSGVDHNVCKNLKSELKIYLPDAIKSLREIAIYSICQESGVCNKDGMPDYIDEQESRSEDEDVWSTEDDE